MKEYLLPILLVYGITNIIVHGSIFYGIKNKIETYALEGKNKFFTYLAHKFHMLVSCMMCTGFWIGTAVGILYGPWPWEWIIANGAYFSGICWFFECITQYLGQGEVPDRSMTVYIHPESGITVQKPKGEEDEGK